MKNFIAYYRVSTNKQGASGLGLQAQQETVKNYIGNNNLIAEYKEIESGNKDKRIVLHKAIEHAKNSNATLIIAKLDRLSRNVSFIFKLKDSNVDFTCCDIPDANTMTIGIFALLAQQERDLIVDRTKKAMEAKKQRMAAGDYSTIRKNENGEKIMMKINRLGSPEGMAEETRIKGVDAIKFNAINNENNIRAFALIKVLRENNISYRTIAANLNESGFKTRKGKQFHANSVKQTETLFKKYLA